MDILNQLRLASADMDLEPAEDVGSLTLQGSGCTAMKEPFLSKAVLPNGQQIPLLKSLLTTACEKNCFYCPFRAGRDTRRVTFKPEEMASTFMSLHQAGVVQGIFLSSGVVGGGMRTQDRIIAVAEILRHKLHYSGYMHLKLMPGAERDQVERTMQLADRVSVNLEAPNEQRLALLAPRKTFLEELLQPLRWVQEIRTSRPGYHGWKHRWPSVTTQFVVGAVGESDLELLSTTEQLNLQIHLSRAYYSAFRPIRNTPLENHPAENRVREHRLYQASFLLRDYGFDLEDMSFEPDGKLPLEIDPKLAWAQAHLAEAPLEINRANMQELLHIPGIGPKGARSILHARRSGKLLTLEDLSKIGVNPQRSAPYILLNGIQPARQLSLF